MLARTWTVAIDPTQAEEYEAFARDVSLPMFRSAPGCAAVVMEREGGDCTVLTVWRSPEELRTFENAAGYLSTVDAILARGFLRGEQRIRITEALAAWTGCDR